jgi:hypothetical protein
MNNPANLRSSIHWTHLRMLWTIILFRVSNAVGRPAAFYRRTEAAIGKPN